MNTTTLPGQEVLPASDRTEGPDFDELLVKQVAEFLAAEGMTQAAAARQMGVDSSALNSWLNGKPKGNWKVLEQAAADFLKTAPLRMRLAVEKFETACYRKMRTAFLETKETNLTGVFIGAAGSGKTSAAEMLCLEFSTSVLITAYTLAGGAGAMMNRLWRQIATRGFQTWRKKNPGGSKIDFVVERFAGSNRMIFVDNCNRLTVGGIRFWIDFWEQTRCPVLFIGTGEFLETIRGLTDSDTQLSRVGTFWEYKMNEPGKMAEGIVKQLLPAQAGRITPLAASVAAGPGHGRSVMMQANMCRRLMLGGMEDAGEAFTAAGTMLLRRSA